MAKQIKNEDQYEALRDQGYSKRNLHALRTPQILVRKAEKQKNMKIAQRRIIRAGKKCRD